MKNALIAGGAGFIGSHLAEYLLARDYKVDVADNLVTGKKRNIEHLFENPNFNWLEIDINHEFYLNNSYDEIYNLASPASPKDFDSMPIFIMETTSVGLKNLLEQGLKMNCPVLYTSTSEVYGDPEVHPQTEDYRGNVNTIGIRSCYDEAKRYGEALCYAYMREKKSDIRIARIFNTYGPRMAFDDGRVIPNFFTQAIDKKPLTIYGDGSQTRSMCFVSDMVEGLYKLMQNKDIRPINIGNPIELTMNELAEMVNKIAGNTAGVEYKTLPQDDPLRRKPDISRANKALNWEPKVKLEDGLEVTYKWFNENYKA